MPRIIKRVTVTDDGDGTYDFSVDDVAVPRGNHTIHFQRWPANTTAWKFTNISVWEGEKSDEPSTPSLVPPFTMRRLQDEIIKIEDGNPDTTHQDVTYHFRLYGEYGDVAIDHDPEIVNKGE